jgi:superfamily I DNA/RNA helicase
MYPYKKRYKILGGPGCGKTTEILNIIGSYFKGGMLPEQLLMIGFAKATVTNLRERCISELNFSEKQAESIKTIHKYCKDKLPGYDVFSSQAKSEFKNKIKTDPDNWIMLDDPKYIATDNEDDMAAWTETEDKKFFSIFSLIGQARHQLKKTVEQVLDFSDNTDNFQFSKLLRGEISYVYNNYLKFKKVNNLIDFEDMLEKALVPNIEFPSYEVVMVDEVQDLSKLEWKVISKIGVKTKELFLVGDDDQSIFGWKGADPRIFLKWPCSNIRTLKETYRLPKKIYNLAQKIISEIPDNHRLGNTYECNNKDGELTTINGLHELDNIIEIDSEAFFMARTWNKCSLFVRYLKDRGIIWEEKQRNAEDVGSFKSSIPKSVKEVLKSWDMLKNGIAIRGPYIAKLADVLKPGLVKYGMKKALTDKNLWPKEFTDKNVTYTFKQIQDQFKVLADINKKWYEVFNFTTKRKQTKQKPNALFRDDDDYNSYLRFAWENDNTLSKSKIRVSTIHGLKGMESNTVILSNDWGFAGLKNYNSGIARLEEEELRCCYVGVTRTKKSLVIFDPILQSKSYTFPLLGPQGYIN